MKKSQYLLILILLSPLFSSNTSQAQGVLDPVSLEISGTIQDNYANISYALVFNNTEGSEDLSIFYEISTPNDLFLSNVSASTGDLTYWGKVYPILKAQKVYNQSVSANKSAILVTNLGDYNRFDINIKAGRTMVLTAYYEGYITRGLGKYSLDIFSPRMTSSSGTTFSINLNITSSLSSVIRAGLDTPGFSRIPITNGKQLKYESTKSQLSTAISLQYTLSVLDTGGKLITYSNGTDNFFAYLLAPEIYDETNREPREYIFVIDVSGSMSGTKIAQAKTAFIAIMETLTPGDLFNVISFSTNINQFQTESVLATTSNIDSARTWVDSLSAGGGTNINDALTSALASFVGDNTAKAIAFLSDGQPTSGVTDTDAIITSVRTANTRDVSVFSIAFGENTDEGLMASLAYDNNGLFTVILADDSAVAKLEEFYQYFATPVALGITMSYQNAFGVYPKSTQINGAIFNGSEILQTGRFTDTLSISTTIIYSTGDLTYVSTATSTENNPQVELIWAHNSIKQMLKLLTITTDEAMETELVDLAVEYGIVVPGYTGMTVVIDEPVQEDTPEDGTRDDFNAVAPKPPVDTVHTQTAEQIDDKLSATTGSNNTSSQEDTPIKNQLLFSIAVLVTIPLLKKKNRYN